MSNILWAYGKGDGIIEVDGRLLDSLAKTALNAIADFIPKNLSNTARALATLNHEAPSLFDALADAAQFRIGEFNAQELANMAWAFATFKHEAPLLFYAIEKCCSSSH
jgi:hypothetical protein